MTAGCLAGRGSPFGKVSIPSGPEWSCAFVRTLLFRTIDAYEEFPAGLAYAQRRKTTHACRGRTGVATFALGFVPECHTSARMHHAWFLDDQAIAIELEDIAPGVGQRDVVDFIRVEPNLALAALQDRCGKPLLQL